MEYGGLVLVMYGDFFDGSGMFAFVPGLVFQCYEF